MASDAECPPVISSRLPNQLPDLDPSETQEWVESLDAVVRARRAHRARSLMLSVLQRAQQRWLRDGIGLHVERAERHGTLPSGVTHTGWACDRDKSAE
ncbi:MAG: hypothetical protein ACRDTX_16430 [Pseudonocardiaceae bacterium]